MARSLYLHLAQNILDQHHDVVEGNMMSSPGLKCNNKVFVFHYKEEMGFRLGPGFTPDEFGLRSARPLSPFRTKPPLKDWFMVHDSERGQWERLTILALEFTRTL